MAAAIVMRRFTTTRLKGLCPSQGGADLQYALIGPVLDRELGPRHARLFAEYEPESSDRRAWYADVSAPPCRVRKLPSDQAVRVLADAARLIDDIRGLAAALAGGTPQGVALSRTLLAALTFPLDDVWYGPDQPIIVNWGYHRRATPAGTPQAILDLLTPVSGETSCRAIPTKVRRTEAEGNAGMSLVAR